MSEQKPSPGGGVSMMTLVHVGTELVIITGLTWWMSRRISSNEERCRLLEEKTTKMEQFIMNMHQRIFPQSNTQPQTPPQTPPAPPNNRKPNTKKSHSKNHKHRSRRDREEPEEPESEEMDDDEIDTLIDEELTEAENKITIRGRKKKSR